MTLDPLDNLKSATKRWIDWQLDKYFELSFLQTYGQKAEGIYSGGCRYWWEELSSHWLREPVGEAAQDIIVRVANDANIQNCLWVISHNPVYQLVRNREMVEAPRVQEFDPFCLRRLGQMAGTTIFQKAAMTRKLWALRRTHSFDNLENRVFMYVLKTLIKRAINYLDLNKSFCNSERFKQVESLLNKLNKMLATTPCVSITPLTPSFSLTPNNCLLYDNNYSLIWTLYRQLLRIEKIKEMAQLYQHTLWRESGRQFVGALLASSESIFKSFASSCVYLRSDMHEGRWTQNPNPPGPLSCDKKSLVIYDVWDEQLPDPESSILNIINADQLLALQEDDKMGIRLVVWYHHSDFEKLNDNDEFLESCLISLKKIAANLECVYRGLVIFSSIPGSEVSSGVKCAEGQQIAYIKLPLAPTPSYELINEVFFKILARLLEIS